MSDIETRIVARNKECCRVIDGFVQEYFSCDSDDNKNDNNNEDENYNRKDDYSSIRSSSRGSVSDSGSGSFDSNNEDDSNKRQGGVYRIAVLYGVYHITDLNRRLIEDYQFKIDPQYQGKQYTAWKIAGPVLPSLHSSPSSSLFRFNHLRSSILSILPRNYLFNRNEIFYENDHNNYNGNKAHDVDTSSRTSTSLNRIDSSIVADDIDDNILNLKASDLVIVSMVLSIYLFLNAIDWWYLGHFILLAIEQFSFTDDSSSTIRIVSSINSGDNRFDSFLQYFNSNNFISNEFIIAIIYIISYIQRHLFLLRKISYVGIQWDRGLFTDL